LYQIPSSIHACVPTVVVGGKGELRSLAIGDFP
jgi:hypothetical protein